MASGKKSAAGPSTGGINGGIMASGISNKYRRVGDHWGIMAFGKESKSWQVL